VEHVGLRSARMLERAAPRAYLALELEVVQLGEHAVRRARAILEGRMDRSRSRRPLEAQRLSAGERRAEVDYLHVSIESPSIAIGIASPARSRDERHRPSELAQPEREGAGHVRRPAAR